MATSESLSAESAMNQYDADELGQYRSLSSMAVISAVLGCCSVLMFATPLMVVLPLAAAACALLALQSIAASEGGLTGSRLALAGLALATIFAVGAFARVLVRDSLMRQQVDVVCQEWLDLASQGQVDDMLALMTPEAAAKLKPQLEVAQPDSFFSGMLSSALMRQDPLVVSLSKMREAGELRVRASECKVFAKLLPPQAVADYVASAAETDDFACQIIMKRFRTGIDQQTWLIDSWSLLD